MQLWTLLIGQKPTLLRLENVLVCFFSVLTSGDDNQYTFHIVRAQGQHVMCSYNSINGIPACGNNYTLNKVLRDDWNFEGFVVSDYDAMAQIYTTHGYAKNYEEAVSIAIKAGCGMFLHSS